MSKYTGVLGTRASQLGNFVLGLGLATVGDNSQTVDSTITVDQSISFEITNPHRVTVADTITVTPTIHVNVDRVQTVAHTITVTSSPTPHLDPQTHLTQEVREVVYNTNPIARITQRVIEVVYKKPVLQTVTDTITVSQTIVPAGDRTKIVSHTVNVSQSISGHNSENRQTVSHTVNVAQSITARSTIVHITVADSITVSQVVRSGGDVHATVAHTITVASAASGRNNKIRITVATVISVSSPGSGTSNHEVMNHGVTCSQAITAFSNHPRLTVAHTVGVTQTIVAVTPYQTVGDTITVSQAITFRITGVHLTVADNVTVATTASAHVNPTRITVTDSIFIPQNFPQIWPATGRNDHNRQTIGHTVSVATDMAGGSSNRAITVVDTIAVTSTVRTGWQYQLVAHLIGVAHQITGGGSRREMTVVDTVAVSQAVSARNDIIRKTVAQDIIVTTVRTARTPRVEDGISDTIHVSQLITSRVVLGNITVAHAISVNQDIGVRGNRHLTVADTINVTSGFRDRNNRQTVIDTITVDDRMRQIPMFMRHTITVSTKVNRRFDEDIVETLPITQTLERQMERNRHVVQTLPVVPVLSRSMVWTRHLTDTLIIPEGSFLRPVSFWPYPITVPVLHGGLMANLVVLQSGSDAVTLPAAVLGDTKANANNIIVQRSMNADTVTIIKSTDRQKLKLNFRVSLKKSRELQAFIVAHIADLIRLSDWNGGIWLGRLQSNPFTNTHAGRSATEQEFVTFEIDFEGTKVGG